MFNNHILLVVGHLHLLHGHVVALQQLHDPLILKGVLTLGVGGSKVEVSSQDKVVHNAAGDGIVHHHGVGLDYCLHQAGIEVRIKNRV